jgi:hypothetical protein
VLVQRVVELVEATSFPGLDRAQILAALVAVLGAAGLVSVRDFPLGGRHRLALLVAEPLPWGRSAVGVELAWPGTTEALLGRLSRDAAHPAVDALVVVGTSTGHRWVPRQIAGVPVHPATIRLAPDASLPG